MRHSAVHNQDDLFPYKCTNCRQVFESHKDLQKHAAVHTTATPWKCDHCSGMFKSSPALRRHKDQCRACDVPQEQSDILVSVHSPLDPFSFIPGDTDPNYPLQDKQPSPDSGIESSPQNTTPERNPLEVDPYELYGKRKEKEDDEDSGFRSRLNSVTQSSPGSSVFSGEGASPHRKHSDEHASLFSNGFEGPSNYVHQPLFGDFDPNEFPDSLMVGFSRIFCRSIREQRPKMKIDQFTYLFQLDQQRPSTIWGH